MLVEKTGELSVSTALVVNIAGCQRPNSTIALSIVDRVEPIVIRHVSYVCFFKA